MYGMIFFAGSVIAALPVSIGGIGTRELAMATGAGYLFLGAEELPPGSSVPRHRHELDEELLIVQEGEVTFLLNDTAHVAPAGSVVYLPPRNWIARVSSPTRTCSVRFG